MGFREVSLVEVCEAPGPTLGRRRRQRARQVYSACRPDKTHPRQPPGPVHRPQGPAQARGRLRAADLTRLIEAYAGTGEHRIYAARTNVRTINPVHARTHLYTAGFAVIVSS
jgi:hypothetical protein